VTRFVDCAKLKKKAEGLEIQPYPGELGKRIYAEISKEAWQQWLGHQTILINEYRLSMLDPKAREFLANEMQLFLFNSESKKPASYTPPE
jgi:Fe-S cluster biosynthesis and repair protein YggX